MGIKKTFNKLMTFCLFFVLFLASLGVIVVLTAYFGNALKNIVCKYVSLEQHGYCNFEVFMKDDIFYFSFVFILLLILDIIIFRKIYKDTKKKFEK